jgi:uncharacterized membrane protein
MNDSFGKLSSIKPHALYLRHVVATSFWFVPALMTLAGAALAIVSESTSNTSWLAANLVSMGLLPAESDTSRQILSTIVGSTITVTTLVFSMTLIALSQAAQQLGPRLLAEFRGSRTNQIVLGAFVATFVHALLTLTMSTDPVPVVSVFGSVVLVLLCFGLLIYFIHHVARSMEADHILALVNEDIVRALKSAFPGDGEVDQAAGDHDGKDFPSSDHMMIRAPASGYVQTVDYDALVELAADFESVIRVKNRPGHFVIAGGPIGTVSPSPDDCEAAQRLITRAIVVGQTRTAAQDVEFSVKAMVEVALRALSPGINDIFTAMTCIDRLGGAVALAMKRNAPPSRLHDDAGRLRVVRDAVTVSGLMDSAFNEIRQNLAGKVPGLIRLLDTFASLTPFIRSEEHLAAVRTHTEKTERLIKATVDDPDDLDDLEDRMSSLRQHLAQVGERLQVDELGAGR